MVILYDQYNNLTPEEKKDIRLNPPHVLFIKESKEKAFSETKKKFGFNTRNDESGVLGIVIGQRYYRVKLVIIMLEILPVLMSLVLRIFIVKNNGYF